ncbi:MAG: nucleotide sugar dehydrogenase [Magnetospirillum sp.]|nr:nucleotide sugar dehydrogenase [Magnetospirillum sp.]
MRIAVVGLGYVGAVTLACLAKLGHNVTGVDAMASKVEQMAAGRAPVVEPGLDQLVAEGVAAGHIRVTTDLAAAVAAAEVVFVCVGTPSTVEGAVELSHVTRVAGELAGLIAGPGPVVVFRSTVPPGTMETVVAPIFGGRAKLAFHPEFMREGTSVHDFMEQPPVVLAPVANLDTATLEGLAARLYPGIDYRLSVVAAKTAEMIKYVNNVFHAVKVTFANEVGRACRQLGVDTHELTRLFLADDKLNVSPAYLRPGFAFGGSCLPKDLRALLHVAGRGGVDLPMIGHVAASNTEHVYAAWRLIAASGAKSVGFLGLGFKPATDDVRESPFCLLAELCAREGLAVRIHDGSLRLDKLVGRNAAYLFQHIEDIAEHLAASPAEVVAGAEVVVLCHATPEHLAALDAAPDKAVIDLAGLPAGRLGWRARSPVLPG